MKKSPSEYRRHLYARLVQCQVPHTLHEGLVEYLAARRPVGHFLTAVLSNDLMEACNRADYVSRLGLANVVTFLVAYAPANCWGNPKAVADWLASPEPAPELFE